MKNHGHQFAPGLLLSLLGCGGSGGNGTPPVIQNNEPVTVAFLSVDPIPSTPKSRIEIRGTAGPETKAIRITCGTEDLMLGVRSVSSFAGIDTVDGDGRLVLHPNQINHLFLTELNENFEPGMIGSELFFQGLMGGIHPRLTNFVIETILPRGLSGLLGAPLFQEICPSAFHAIDLAITIATLPRVEFRESAPDSLSARTTTRKEEN